MTDIYKNIEHIDIQYALYSLFISRVLLARELI